MHRNKRKPPPKPAPETKPLTEAQQALAIETFTRINQSVQGLATILLRDAGLDPTAWGVDFNAHRFVRLQKAPVQ